MAGFGFTPDDGDEAERANRENLEAMMRQMQEQIAQQFKEMGINPGAGFAPGGFPMAGLGALFGGGTQEALPLAPVRDSGKKFVSTTGSRATACGTRIRTRNRCWRGRSRTHRWW